MTQYPNGIASNKVVSVVIGSYNRLKFLKLAIDTVRRELEASSLSHELIVVDGGSTDGSLQWLVRQKDIITIVQHNRGEWRGKKIERRSWGYFMNLGFKAAQGKFVCMLSDDCLVVPGAIRNGVSLFEERLKAGEKVGAVAFYWRNWPEQDKYWVGLTLGDNMFVNHGLYLKEALETVGYIDEETFFFYQADGDLCLKMWHNGYRVIASPDSYVEHYSHANLDVRESNGEMQQMYLLAYFKKWEGIFYDPDLGNSGGWLTKEFIDTGLTARKFKLADPFKCYIKSNVLKVLTSLAPPRRGRDATSQKDA